MDKKCKNCPTRHKLNAKIRQLKDELREIRGHLSFAKECADRGGFDPLRDRYCGG
jgi:hypothetical protein